MNDKVKYSWLSSPTSVIVILSVLLNAMGVLTVRTFIVRMGLPTNFFETTPIDYLQWGVKAVVILVMFVLYITIVVAIVALIVVIISFFFRQTVFRSKSVKELLERLVLWFRIWSERISVSMFTGKLFVISLTVFLFYWSTQKDVINGFWETPDCPSKFEVPLVFKSLDSNKSLLDSNKSLLDSNKSLLDSNKSLVNSSKKYPYFSATLIIILSLTLLLSIRARKRPNGEKMFPKIFTCGIFALWLFALALWAMPYRLMQHNEFEKVRYNDSTAFVIAEKDSRLFLYVPGECPFLIEKNDTLLHRSGKKYYENIFNQSKKLKEEK